MRNSIELKNIRVNNLKNISLDIPHNKFVVVTGVSGSGKSSLIRVEPRIISSLGWNICGFFIS